MKATLDGVDLLSEGGTAGWALTWGVAPYVRGFIVPRAVADHLMAGTKHHGSTLVLEADGLPSVNVKGLTILRSGPGPRPELASVVVADRRWAWSYKHVRVLANVRTRTGDRQRKGDGPLVAQALTDDEAYRSWSTDGGSARSAQRIISLVFDQIEPGNYSIQGGDAGATDGVASALADKPENALVDDPGDYAASRAFGYAGGVVSSYVDEEGRVVIAPVATDGGSELLGAGPDLFPFPVGARGDRRMERPSAYRVEFDRRFELRADYAGDGDEGDFGDGTVTRDDGPPPLDLVCTLPLPDERLTVGGREVTTGTLVPLASYLDAKAGTWSGKDLAGLPDLTLPVIRGGWFIPGCLQMWADPTKDPTGVNARAVSAVRGAFRALLQLRRALRERLVDVEATLTSVVDVKSGTRAPSPVYADYATWTSWRFPRQEAPVGGPNDLLIRNVFADRGSGGPIVGVPPERLGRAPAVLSVVDADLGMFRVDYPTDLTGYSAQVSPGALVPDSIPSTDPAADNVLRENGALRDDYRLAVIFSAGLASERPGDSLYSVSIDAAPLANGQPCLGPVRVLRVPAASLEAKFGWDESRREDIRSVLGGDLGASALDDLLLNRSELEAYALAVARADLSAFLDRAEGEKTLALHAAAPRGGAGVAHEVSPAGAHTKIAFPGSSTPGAPAEAHLPDGLRRKVLKRLP